MKINSIEGFLLFCSGTSKNLIRDSNEFDLSKQKAIGLIILLTGILATLTGSYAFYTIFSNPNISILFGILWGLMIFTLDRFILLSFTKQESVKANISQIIPRILLASVIAIVIARPVELRLFDSEIRKELIISEQVTGKKAIDSLNVKLKKDISNNITIIEIEKKISKENSTLLSLKRNRISIEAQKKNIRDNYISEARGQSGSVRGIGPVAKRIEALLQKQDNKLTSIDNGIKYTNITKDSLSSRSLNIKDSLNLKNGMLLDSVENDYEKKINNYRKGNSIPFFTSNKTLNKLSKKEDSIKFSIIFISILFLIIELLPVFVKIISKRSLYDYNLLSELNTANNEYKKNKVAQAEDLALFKSNVNYYMKSKYASFKLDWDKNIPHRSRLDLYHQFCRTIYNQPNTKKEDTKKEDTKKEDTKKEDTNPQDTNPQDTNPQDTNPPFNFSFDNLNISIKELLFIIFVATVAVIGVHFFMGDYDSKFILSTCVSAFYTVVAIVITIKNKKTINNEQQNQ